MNKIIFKLLPIFALLLVAVSCLKPSNYPYPNPKPPKNYTHPEDEKPRYDFINPLVDRADFIFEGKAISSESFYGYVNGQKGIYTCFVLEIYKVFKGDTKAHKVEICTDGGLYITKKPSLV